MVINQLKRKKGYCLVLLILAMACLVKGNGQTAEDISDSMLKKLHVKNKIESGRGSKFAFKYNYNSDGRLLWIMEQSDNGRNCTSIATYTYDSLGKLVSKKQKYCDNSTQQVLRLPNQEVVKDSFIVNYEYDKQSKLKRSFILNDSSKLAYEKIYDDDSMKAIENTYFKHGEYFETITYFEIKNVPKMSITHWFDSSGKCYYYYSDKWKNTYNHKHQLVKQYLESINPRGAIKSISRLEYYPNGLLKYIVYGDNTDKNISGNASDKFFDYEYYDSPK